MHILATLKQASFCPTCCFPGHKRSRGVRAGKVQLPSQARDHHPEEPDVLRQARGDSCVGGGVGMRQEYRRRPHGALLRPLQWHHREYLSLINTGVSCMKNNRKRVIKL